MENINLLPDEFKPKKYALNLSKTLKKVSIIGFLVFVVLAALTVGLLTLVNVRLRQSEARRNKLVAEVNALKNTEQKVFLIKDRLSIIGENLNTPSASDKIDVLQDVYSLSKDIATPIEAQVSAEVTNVTLSMDSSSKLFPLLSGLTQSGKFNSIKMKNLEYNPERGYEINLDVLKAKI